MPDQPQPAGRGRTNRRAWTSSGGVFAASLAYLAWLQFLTPRIPGYDGYFHIKFAQLFPDIGFVREFKWAALSSWATDFADKEILFHLYLVPFGRLDDTVFGVKIATILLGAAVVTSFYLVLRRNGVQFPVFWTILLFASGGSFLVRLTAPRPQLLSILLLLWAVHCILNRKRVALAAIVVVYSFSYTAFHLPFAVAVLVSAHLFLTEDEFDWKTPLAAAGAMLLGMLVNPYFPNNALLFWVQNFAVPWMALHGRSSLNMAGELAPMTTREFMATHVAILLPYIGAVFLAMFRPETISRRTRNLLVISAVFLFMSLMMRRFLEYMVPTTIFFLAAFYTNRLRALDIRVLFVKQRWSVIAVISAIVIAVAGLAARSALGLKDYFDTPRPSREQAALYLKNHTDPDELVFTCDWDDTPELFYHNHHNRYPVMLDPNFMYYRDPDVWQEWYDVARGGFSGRTYDILARDYRFGACTWDFEELKRIVEDDPRMEIVHDDGDVWVFRIDRDNPTIDLDQFLKLAPDR